MSEAAQAQREIRRGRWRRLRSGLATLLGGRPQGFFIPYRYAAQVEACAYPALLPLFADREPQLRKTLAAIESFGSKFQQMVGPAPQPRFDQDWFPRLDAAAAYAMVCRTRPERIVEVGSGHSTRFLARAIADEKLETELTCIDPAPRAALAGLDVCWIEQVLQQAPHSCFEALGPGDILFIDSSHVLMPGSDVDILLNQILPSLSAGVLVHVHDVFLPDAYPEAWSWRGYNEQSAVAVLLHSGAYELQFASHYVATRLADEIAGGSLAPLPHGSGAFESSLWLCKRSSP